LLTTDEMRRLESAANAAGLPYAAMMERAGRAVALAVRERLGATATRVVVLVGPGNNGGDGLVAARTLRQWGYTVGVYLWKRRAAEDPTLALAQQAGVPILRHEEEGAAAQLGAWLSSCAAVVDALLGTGARGPLRPELVALLELVRRALEQPAAPSAPPLLREVTATLPPSSRARPLVVAVDLPSGLDADTGDIDPAALAADLTITFAYPKRGHYLFPGAATVGALRVAAIGIDPALAPAAVLTVATPKQVARLLPPRPAHAHKGTFGKALLVAGSRNYTGAPCLAALAAYRAGAGLVTLAVAQTIYPLLAAKLTEPTFLPLADEDGALTAAALPMLREALPAYDALLVGPGLGRHPGSGELVRALLADADLPATPAGVSPPATVVDADGLNHLAAIPQWWERQARPLVLTPHLGEMARLLGCALREVEADRFGVAQRAAQQWRCTVVLKGAYTVVASPDGSAVVIPFANAALATAGTGDVLAGVIVGLLAQGLPAAAAAQCGAYLHALAGELWRRAEGTTGLLASDLLPLLPRARRALEG
jgi:NAD(P)H-hydrate epimerase